MYDNVATSELVERLADLGERERVIIHETCELSGADLEAMVTAYARWLARVVAPTPGDRIAVVSENTPLTVAMLIAHLRLGLVHVPVPPRYSADEIAHLVTDCGACLVRPDDEVILDDSTPIVWPTVRQDALAWIVYTSGTTGRPKGVMTTHASLAANLLAVTASWAIGPHDRIIAALPLFHVHGLGLAVLGSLLRGASVLLVTKFSADRVVHAFRDEGATVFMGVPTMYHLLLEHLAAHDVGDVLRRARLFTAGSAALAAEAFRAFERLTGHAILERYGMTETGFTLSNPYRGERRPGAVGLPVPGVEVRIVGEDGAWVADGELGEIEVRGAGLMAGYWGRPEASAQSMRGDWFKTGDTAVREDGYVRIVGRTSTDIIKTGGFKVGAREIEDVLLASGVLVECAVLGVPDPRWGEVVAAVVVPVGELDVAALEAWVASRLVDYKRPRRWSVIDALPRNALGKVQKPGLRARFATLSDAV